MELWVLMAAGISSWDFRHRMPRGKKKDIQEGKGKKTSQAFCRGQCTRPCKECGRAYGKDYYTHIGSHDAALGSHEDETDEDGWSQHPNCTHQRISSLRLGAAPLGCSCPCDYTQEASEASDCSKDQTIKRKKRKERKKIRERWWFFCFFGCFSPKWVWSLDKILG